MKRKTPREILSEAFVELAAEKSIDRITVGDICRNCGYSSSSFYRHFRDKYDLIAWYYAEKMAVFMRRISSGELSWKDAYLESCRYYEEQREYLKNLLLHTKEMDSFLQNMVEINFYVYLDFLRQKRGGEPDGKTILAVRLYCLGAAALVSEWITGKWKAAPEEVAEILEESFPLPLNDPAKG